MLEFKKILENVEKYKEARMHITGEIAEAVQNVKMFIVKGEHERMLDNMYHIQIYNSYLKGWSKKNVQ